MKTIDRKNYEEITQMLTENGIPRHFLDDLVVIVDDFERHHVPLKQKNPRAFNILLMGVLWKFGYIAGKAAAK